MILIGLLPASFTQKNCKGRIITQALGSQGRITFQHMKYIHHDFIVSICIYFTKGNFPQIYTIFVKMYSTENSLKTYPRQFSSLKPENYTANHLSESVPSSYQHWGQAWGHRVILSIKTVMGPSMWTKSFPSESTLIAVAYKSNLFIFKDMLWGQTFVRNINGLKQSKSSFSGVNFRGSISAFANWHSLLVAW